MLIAFIIIALIAFVIISTSVYFNYLNRKECARQKKYVDAFNRSLKLEIYRDNAKINGMPYNRAERLLSIANEELIKSRLI